MVHADARSCGRHVSVSEVCTTSSEYSTATLGTGGLDWQTSPIHVAEPMQARYENQRGLDSYLLQLACRAPCFFPHFHRHALLLSNEATN